MELGINFINNMESLWVKVLRSKYKATECIPNILSSSSCSYIWWSLKSVWKHIQGKMSWKVVTGREVKFWTDSWFRGLGPLSEYCTVPQPTFPNATVYTMVTPECDWNWSCFIGELPYQIIHLLVESCPPLESEGRYICYWKAAKSGGVIKFSIRILG
ncbi:hypothetical protein J1N35_023732 [Gossypium stocksii]|uniref:Reverse transcriptase zinc-binding domain-containing protein n=1 Tax=Gossypium stocksii TaxID=47602 RepID=A0A9D3VJR3_9ROSI|nr:hypothetical protein J1N35_023732 [Gossypium stocksii]